MENRGYKFREGDRVLVMFQHEITQPGISKHQSNEHAPRTDITKATAWKPGVIDMIGSHGERTMYHIILDKPYKSDKVYEKGWVELERLQPYIPEVM